MSSEMFKSLNSGWPAPIQAAILQARNQFMAEAWDEGWIAAETYRDPWVVPDRPRNPYRSES